MRRTVIYAAALVAALAASPAASAAGAKWDTMTTAQRTAVVTKAVRHDRSVVRWWANHRQRAPQVEIWTRRDALQIVTSPAWPMCDPLDSYAPARVCAAQTRLPGEIELLKRLRGWLPETGDWLTAVAIVQRAYPGSGQWLTDCSSSEGGHGEWKFRNDVGALTPARRIDPPNVPGGQMQYFRSTFDGDFAAAIEDMAARGFRLPASAYSWFSPLGQAAAGGWAYFHDRPSGKWTGSRC